MSDLSIYKNPQSSRKTVWLLGSTISLTAINAALGGETWWIACAYLVPCTMGAWNQEIIRAFINLIRLRFRHFKPLFLAALTIVGVVQMSFPAQALWFERAETWLTTYFPSSGTLASLVFNILRGLFLLYVGISIVTVIKAIHEGEDWVAIARTPLIVVLATQATEIITNLIIS
ncbi:MAG: hypothetical protein AB4426_33915 [Xenococcaceae cyanobacterium]